jgi:hypothetical protein
LWRLRLQLARLVLDHLTMNSAITLMASHRLQLARLVLDHFELIQFVAFQLRLYACRRFKGAGPVGCINGVGSRAFIVASCQRNEPYNKSTVKGTYHTINPLSKERTNTI